MNFSTIDLEWKIETAEILCASYWKENSGEVFDTVKQLLEYIFQIENKENEKMIIYSHYGGGSDFLFILQHLIGRKDVYINPKQFFQASSKIISFTCYYHENEFQFRDSFAILPSSLEKISLSLIKERKIEDSGKLEDLDKKRIKTQCLNDARLLYKSIEKFMNILGLNYLCLTAASQALLDMKQRCDFDKIQIQTKEEYETFRPWFFGGHVDVYRRYSTPCFQYDIKSCYPTSMYKYGCPIGNPRETRNFRDGNCGLFIIKTKAQFYNPFFAHKTNLKTYWVNSNDFILATDIELRKLIELGKDFKILKGYEWQLDEKFFHSFVDYWFNFRKLGQAQKEIGKIFLNAGGFGKFAIRRDRDIITFGKDADYYLTEDFNIGIKKEWLDFEYSQIHIAARITAGARILLFEKQNETGIDRLIYSDTDSVFSSESYNFSNSEMGQLEHIRTCKRGYFIGNKFYGLLLYDNSFMGILKGFPEKFQEQAYANALMGKIEFKYKKNQLMKFRSSLHKSGDFVTMNEMKRQIDKIEIKRKLMSDGINTQPYTLQNGELK
jgi:hypothetical protein